MPAATIGATPFVSGDVRLIMAKVSHTVKLELFIEFDTLSDKTPGYSDKPASPSVSGRSAGRRETPMTYEEILSDVIIRDLEREGIRAVVTDFSVDY